MKSVVKSNAKNNEILKSFVLLKEKEYTSSSFVKNTMDFRISLLFVSDFTQDVIGFQDSMRFATKSQWVTDAGLGKSKRRMT